MTTGQSGNCENEFGRDPAGQALAVPVEPASGLAPSGFDPSRRPKASDPEVRAVAIRALAEECNAWGGDYGVDTWATWLARESLRSNGFELAKSLDDRHYIEPDLELVEILDAASSHIWDAERAAVVAWVEATGAKLTLPIGTRISCRYGDGEIIRYDEAQARYIYVPDAEREAMAKTNGGVFIECEAASAIEAATADKTAQQGLAEGESATRQGDAQTTAGKVS